MKSINKLMSSFESSAPDSISFNDRFLLCAVCFRCFSTDWAKRTAAAAAGQEGCVRHPTHKLFWEAGEYIHGKSGTRPQRESANTTTRAKTITFYISPYPPAKHPSARDTCHCGAWCWHAICVTASDIILIQGTILFKDNRLSFFSSVLKEII